MPEQSAERAPRAAQRSGAIRRRAALLVVLLGPFVSACGGGSGTATQGTFGSRTAASLDTLIPVIDVAVGASATQPFIVDTGSPVTLLNSISYGHAQDYSATELQTLSAFGVTFDGLSLVVYGAFTADACGTSEVGGIIGGDLLQRYQLTLDYLGSALYLWNGIHDSPDLGQAVAAATAVPIRVLGGGQETVAGLTVDLPPTRIVVEGALETARKDFARLMREATALQRAQMTPDDPARLHAANAA